MLTHEQMVKKMLTEPAVKEEYDAQAEEFALLDELLRARQRAGLTQAEVAEKMENDPKCYDLVVIGGGPAGINGATTARLLGKTVALVDRHHELGGAGANTGTVPSKTLRETAVALSGTRSRDLYGVDLSLRR